MRKNIILLVFLFIGKSIFGQITDVGYSMEYNSQTCLFDCYLNIYSGQTNTVRDRVQFNAQFTIVTPSKSHIAITQRYMPLENNRDNNGGSPTFWDISSLTESPQKSGNSYYSITPRMIPTSFYYDLNQGDKVKLFSVSVSPMVNCLEDVRLFKNGELISENREGLESDFSNAFTIGGISQKYSRNGNSLYPSKPVIGDINVSNDGQILVNAEINHPGLSICQSEMNYQLYNPEGLMSESEEFLIISKSDAMEGNYRLVVIDNLGCKTEKSFSLLNTNNDQADIAGELSGNEDKKTITFYSSIFPNPSTNLVNLEVSTNIGSRIQANIYDLNGRLLLDNVINVIQNTPNKEYQIETKLNTGIYSLGVDIDGEQVVLHKLIIIE